MSPWDVTAEPAPRHGRLWLVGLAYAGIACVPWCVDCRPWLAAVLSAVALAGLPPALRALPGPYARIRRLRFRDGEWTGWRADGTAATVGIGAGTRVLPGVTFCRLRLEGRPADLWVFRDTLPVADYRRLKVALRCSRPVPAG